MLALLSLLNNIKTPLGGFVKLLVIVIVGARGFVTLILFITPISTIDEEFIKNPPEDYWIDLGKNVSQDYTGRVTGSPLQQATR